MNNETSTAFQGTVMLLLQQLIVVGTPFLFALLGLLINEARKFVKRHASAEKVFLLESIIGTVVQAAEQAGLKDALLKEGTAKKEYAISEAQRILNERGLTNISATTLSTYIEAAINQGLHLGVVNALEGDPIVAQAEYSLPSALARSKSSRG